MRIVDLSNLTELRDIQEMFKTEQCAFLLGSAVSMFAPSDLPTGASIVEQVSRFLLRHPRSKNDDMRDKRLARFVRSAAFEHLFEHYPKQQSMKEYIAGSFSGAEPNLVHSRIVQIANQSKAPIITTNYDCLIEKAAMGAGISCQTIIEYDDCRETPISNIPVFKIHGCTSRPQSIVFQLSQEGIMPDWKYELLYELLDGRTLFIIGYSGQDFEICPALEQAPIQKAYWNAFSLRNDLSDQSQNLQHLANSSKFGQNLTLLEGDMLSLLSLPSLSFQRTNSDINTFVAGDLSSMQQSVWRANFFDSMAAPHAVRWQLKYLKGNVQNRILSGAFYREGQYIRSHKCLFSDTEGLTTDKAFRFELLLDRSFKYRNAGYRTYARLCCLRSLRLWKDLDFQHRRKNFGLLLWSVILNCPTVSPRIRKRAMEKLLNFRLSKGHWGSVYNLMPILEKEGVDIGSISRRHKNIMNARRGYAHIGNISSFIDDFFRDVSDNEITPRQYLYHIEIAELFGLHPNCFKACYAALRSNRVRGAAIRFKIFCQAIRHLFICEYAVHLKLSLVTLSFVALCRFPAPSPENSSGRGNWLAGVD